MELRKFNVLVEEHVLADIGPKKFQGCVSYQMMVSLQVEMSQILKQHISRLKIDSFKPGLIWKRRLRIWHFKAIIILKYTDCPNHHYFVFKEVIIIRCNNNPIHCYFVYFKLVIIFSWENNDESVELPCISLIILKLLSTATMRKNRW